MNGIKTKRIIFLIAAVFLCVVQVAAQEYQWSVQLKNYISAETNEAPDAFLWIPDNCRQVRAVIVGQHNMCEETIFNNPGFRQTLRALGFAVIWITPGIDQRWDVKNGCQRVFDNMMKDLADVSGYSELEFAPIVPLGHSAMATFPWNFAAWNKNRTLAVISYHGDAPRTNLTGYGLENLEWGRNRNIDGIPGLMIEGEYEWWEARVNPALAFRMMYPESCISFLCDAGHGHFDVSDEVINYICLFLKKAAQYRLPENQPLNKPVPLLNVNPGNGWLARRWEPFSSKRPLPAPVAQYKGDPHDAFWYFDEEIAETTEKYYAHERKKMPQYISFSAAGKLFPFDAQSHAQYNAGALKPEGKTLAIHLSAVFTDSLHQAYSKAHSGIPTGIERICGPVEKINDTTFALRFYRMGLNNAKRTNDVWLAAYNKGDSIYKSTVQQFNFKVVYPLTEGKPQHILFPAIADVKEGTEYVRLNGEADSGLPVYYYVHQGPAKIVGNKIVFTKIPPRAKYPVKVTLMAWQYGVEGKVQSAPPVERSFYITR
ncbi:hypothetical protein [Niabella soli]|uniref:hypothetical protein n=1 Tax=Niabella soli TaxID=446683 RepID=UPI0002499B1B|nr:hypothetical protein [Niabella soli]